MIQTTSEATMIVELLKWIAPIGTVAAVGWVLNEKFSAFNNRITVLETKLDLLLAGQLAMKPSEPPSGEHKL